MADFLLLGLPGGPIRICGRERVPDVTEEQQLRCQGVDGVRPDTPRGAATASDIWERKDYPSETTTAPPLRETRYDLSDREFDMMQSVLRMHLLRHNLDRGGRDTGEEEDVEGGGGSRNMTRWKRRCGTSEHTATGQRQGGVREMYGEGATLATTT